MQFIYSNEASQSSLLVKEELYKYIIKARRSKINDILYFRNLLDDKLYFYKIICINKRDALLELIDSCIKIVEQDKKLHLIWSVVDPKTIEKQLPYLNEIGLDKISFYYADFSQKSFKLNFDKFEKILINSSQQCGRSSIIKLDIIESLDEVLAEDTSFVLNFSNNRLSDDKNVKTIILGCEGGFSKEELQKIPSTKIIGLGTNLILRSETAATVLSSKILL